MRVRSLATLAVTCGVLSCLSVPAAAEPMHWMLPHQFPPGPPPTTAQCVAQEGIPCYQPFQFQQAYDMNHLYRSGLTGRGETIAIVDSFGSPTIQGDLQTFDQETGLPAPPSFTIITPAGTPPAYNPSQIPDQVGWAEETSLDVEYAHTMAPGANILLVESPTDETEGTVGMPQIVAAENYVIDHHLGDVISQSFGATEQTFPNSHSIYNLRSAFKNAASHHITVLAASGDGGATDYESDAIDYYPFRAVDWPGSDPLVTGLGGTQLHLNANGLRTSPDSVWNDTALLDGPAASGGGTSSVFGRPSYQGSVAGVVGSARGIPDVSMSAAVDGGALVYLGFGASAGIPPGWYIFGGTSEASPLFSGVVAIADQAAGHPLGQLNPTLYQLGDRSRSGVVDVTSGNNTVTFTDQDPNYPDYGDTFTVTGFDAVRGYDLSSGLGTADGARLVAALARGSR